jgi:hypothetical protein
VLTWVSLCYTPHHWTPEHLTNRLRTLFDSFYLDTQGNLRGGDDKRSYIKLQSVLEAQFLHPIIPRLLRDLLRTFAVRYLPLPSEDTEDLGSHDSVSYVMVQSSLYERKQQWLSSSDWMLNKFNEALSDSGSWPTADKSVTNKLCYDPIPDRERKSQVDSLVPY